MDLKRADDLQRVEAGAVANQLMADLAPYIELYRERCIETFKQCSISDTDGIMGLKHQLLALSHVEQGIRSIIEDGKLAQLELDIDDE